MFTFFTEADPVFGRISWTTGVIWLAALGLSAYVLARWQPANAARRRFWRRWAIGTVAVAGLTLLALVLNFFEVPAFNIRAWIYLFSLATLTYWAYAAYFYFTKLPSDVAAAARASRPVRTNQRSAAPARAKVYNNTKTQQNTKAQPTNGTPAQQPAREPRSVATTSRRESRRDRKRRSR
jgi:hypothetical protein